MTRSMGGVMFLKSYVVGARGGYKISDFWVMSARISNAIFFASKQYLLNTIRYDVP